MKIMVNKSYQKGYRFQQRVKNYLERIGYFVMISPKSRFPDGVAVRNNNAFLFECKINKYLTKEEKRKVEWLRMFYNIPFIVFYRDGRKLRWYWK